MRSYDKTRKVFPVHISMESYELLRAFAIERGMSAAKAATELITRGIERKRADSKRHAGNGHAKREAGKAMIERAKALVAGLS